MEAAGQLLLYALAATGAAAWALLLALLVAWLLIKPWSPENRDHAAKVAELPFAVFAFGCWYRAAGAWLMHNVASPLLVLDLASAFLRSQVRAPRPRAAPLAAAAAATGSCGCGRRARGACGAAQLAAPAGSSARGARRTCRSDFSVQAAASRGLSRARRGRRIHNTPPPPPGPFRGG